jgi:tetratricopeptide (TPR) repeat protein
VPGLRDLGEAERWYQRSLDLRPEQDRVGRAKSLWGMGVVAYERFKEARNAHQAESVLLEFLNAALHAYQQALDLLPADDLEDLAGIHNQLGLLYQEAGEIRQALYHCQQAIKHEEARGDIYGAGRTRHNVALLLAYANRLGDALLYARAALGDFERVGPGAAQDAAKARELVDMLASTDA